MFELFLASITFISLLGAAVGGFLSRFKIPSERFAGRDEQAIILLTNIFVIMTSLMLGLMMNSARSTLDINERNVHALAIDLILLDRGIRALGSQADKSHQHLVEYVELSLKDANIADANIQAEALLDAVGTTLRELRLVDEQQVALWNDARQLYRQTVQQRWVVVDAAGGTIPIPVILVMIGWLTIIFASFGYRAPLNAVAVVTFIVAALLISATLFLILDMDAPTTGLIQVSNQPFKRVLAEIQR